MNLEPELEKLWDNSKKKIMKKKREKEKEKEEKSYRSLCVSKGNFSEEFGSEYLLYVPGDSWVDLLDEISNRRFLCDL